MEVRKDRSYCLLRDEHDISSSLSVSMSRHGCNHSRGHMTSLNTRTAVRDKRIPTWTTDRLRCQFILDNLVRMTIRYVTFYCLVLLSYWDVSALLQQLSDDYYVWNPHTECGVDPSHVTTRYELTSTRFQSRLTKGHARDPHMKQFHCDIRMLFGMMKYPDEVSMNHHIIFEIQSDTDTSTSSFCHSDRRRSGNVDLRSKFWTCSSFALKNVAFPLWRQVIFSRSAVFCVPFFTLIYLQISFRFSCISIFPSSVIYWHKAWSHPVRSLSINDDPNFSLRILSEFANNFCVLLSSKRRLKISCPSIIIPSLYSSLDLRKITSCTSSSCSSSFMKTETLILSTAMKDTNAFASFFLLSSVSEILDFHCKDFSFHCNSGYSQNTNHVVTFVIGRTIRR